MSDASSRAVNPDSRAVKPAQARVRRRAGVRPEVPDHEILRFIGQGAYGEVWLARSVTGAYRAVKVVWREDFEDERTFVREFEGVLNYEPIARSNPGLVHILHVGRHEGAQPYYFYVMELADDAYTGIQIEPSEYVPRTLLRDMQLYGHRPMPLDFVIEVGCQLACALEGLHSEELTHRDVKPSNVVFVNGRAKLADAGLVAPSSQRSFVGTEGYIPPDGPGTPRADVYALAKVLYELGTGKDRLDFPELPTELPDGATHRRWQAFNNIICAAAGAHVGKGSLISAQQLAEKLESLRHDYGARRRRRKGSRVRPMPAWQRALLWGAALLVLSVPVLLVALAPEDAGRRLSLALRALRGESQPTPQSPSVAASGEASAAAESSPLSSVGQLFISSTPSGASVYTPDGNYLDETPYGPVRMEPGQSVRFDLRKEGYADTRVAGTVPAGGVLTLSAELKPYRPPVPGKPWQDAQGTVYMPDGAGSHRASTAVTAALFAAFQRSEGDAANIPCEAVPGTDLIRTSQTGISAYTLWLTHLCEQEGTIGRDHLLIPRPEPRTMGDDGLCAYRLSTALIQKTPITIYTNPAGATVMLNGRMLGVTPMIDMQVPLAPYFLEVRMPGYSTVRRSGLSPRALFLNLVLRQNNSVIFGGEWINSLGMKFQPAGANLMAGATEVRVSDYATFCSDTGRTPPPEPDFEQNEHHPVVNVSREDAEAFARWLTHKERSAGYIEETDSYRLPDDEEWSALAGLLQEEGRTPYERHLSGSSRAAQAYPWGLRWPPHRSTGNFADTSALLYLNNNNVIPGYRDGFPHTSPVGSFAPNALGLHDLDGNVAEWVGGEYGGPEDFGFRHYGVTRGGDYTSFRPGQLSTSSRSPHPPTEKRETIGFRLMLERSVQAP